MTERVYLQMSAQQERNPGGWGGGWTASAANDPTGQTNTDGRRRHKISHKPPMTRKHISSIWLLTTRGMQRGQHFKIKVLILKRFCDINTWLPVLLKGSVVKKAEFFLLSVLCGREKSLYASTCDAPLTAFNSQFSYLPPTTPHSCRLIMKPQQGYIVRNSFRSPWLKRLNLIFFKHPLSSFPHCHGTQGCHYNGCRPHPFIILLTCETKHIYITCSQLPSSLNHTMFCCV